MLFISLLKGIFVGLVVSVPTGPIGFLTIKRTINDGFLSGFITGLGAVFSDLIYGIIVIIGLRNTADFFSTYENPMHVIGGLALITLGVFTYFSIKSKKHQNEINQTQNYFMQFISSFFVTMINPVQIISFTALLGPLAVFHNSFNSSVIFLSGLLLGSLVWWTSLAFIVSKIRSSFSDVHINFVNKIAGGIIVFSGVFILMHLFWN